MKISFSLLAPALLLLSGSCALAQPATVGVDTLLRQESDVSRLPQLRDWTSNLQSSHDPTGGNADFSHYVTRDEKTATIFDQDGPGAIVRLWSAGPWVNIKITIDDNPTPVIATFYGKFFDGSFPPFVHPIAAKFSGGFYSYLPIPYAKHCRITVENFNKDKNLDKFYYQVNYLNFAPNTPVRSFALPLLPADQSALQDAVTAWQATAPAALPAAKTIAVDAGQTAQLSSATGAGVLQTLQFQGLDAADADLRHLILRAYFDGHAAPDIEAPVADFFGNAFGRKPFNSLLLSQSADGLMQARFPMPFGKAARFTLENGTGKPLQVVWGADVIAQPFNPKQVGYFHAQWSQAITKTGVAYPWLHVAGQRGHFVGIVQTMNGPKKLNYLEGDELFRADDQKWGASEVASTVVGPWNGTGTEDTFNGGYYFFPGPAAAPLNGLLVKDELEKSSRIEMYRWFLDDAPVFQSSLDAQLEHGYLNNTPGIDYSSVVYWYSDGPNQAASETSKN